jgi:hypothetical protein
VILPIKDYDMVTPKSTTVVELIGRSILLAVLAGSAVGAVLAGGYGLVGFLAAPIQSMLSGLPETSVSAHLHEVPSLLLLALLYSLGFGIFGAIIGGTFGLVLGAINGCAIGLLTCAWFMPLTHPQQYRWSAQGLSLLLTLIAGGIIIRLVGDISLDRYWIAYIGIPILLTFPCAYWASHRLATWYIASTGHSN